MLIQNANVFKENAVFETADIFIEGDFISDKKTEHEDTVIDASGCYAIPGLTDIHFHGCVGHDFCDASHEAISAIAEYEAANGITTICPATMTLSDEDISNICSAASTYPNEKGAVLCGINMEGPFLSKAKKGAQNGAYLQDPNLETFQKWNKLSGNMVKLLAIAPEVPHAMECIEKLSDQVVLSIAHTTADYDIAKEAFDKGASHVTHLYNAMPPFSHRAPGVIGAAFDAKHSHVELICDGIHIHPSVVRATFQLFGSDRVILISDSMMATGMPDGDYSLGGQAVKVVGNTATLADGTIAGSSTNLMDCMRTAVQKMQIPLETAVKAAAVNPAKAIGIYDKFGSLTPGKYANIVLLNKDLSLKAVILKGKIYQND